MLEWTKKLIHLRRSSRALNDGDLHHMKVEHDAEKGWLTMQRGAVRTLMNIGQEAVRLKMREGEGLQLASREGVVVEGEEMVLPAMSLAVATIAAQEASGGLS